MNNTLRATGQGNYMGWGGQTESASGRGHTSVLVLPVPDPALARVAGKGSLARFFGAFQVWGEGGVANGRCDGFGLLSQWTWCWARMR
jgi:hypothetical protein